MGWIWMRLGGSLSLAGSTSFSVIYKALNFFPLKIITIIISTRISLTDIFSGGEEPRRIGWDFTLQLIALILKDELCMVSHTYLFFFLLCHFQQKK